MRVLLLFIVLISLTSRAIAEEGRQEFISYQDSLGFVRYADLVLKDDVADTCWLSPSQSMARVHLILEQNDIQVLKEAPAFTGITNPRVEVFAFGQRVGAACVASAEFTIFFNGNYVFSGHDGESEYVFSSRNALRESRVLMWGEDELSARLANFFETEAANFVADVLSARRDSRVDEFFLQFPNLTSAPMSMSDLQRLIDAQ